VMSYSLMVGMMLFAAFESVVLVVGHSHQRADGSATGHMDPQHMHSIRKVVLVLRMSTAAPTHGDALCQSVIARPRGRQRRDPTAPGRGQVSVGAGGDPTPARRILLKRARRQRESL